MYLAHTYGTSVVGEVALVRTSGIRSVAVERHIGT